MASDITLTAATRQSLLALQNTAASTATIQNQLATGKKVSSALDNPVSFFTAQSLSQRSGDLSSLLDGISNGIQAIQAANQGITSIQKLVDQAKSVANQAAATQITTAGSASGVPTVLTAGATLNLYKNGTAVPVTIAANSTIDTAITALNTALGAGTFTKSTDGTKLVMNSSADIEFKTAADQTGLGFATGTGTAANYGTTNTTVAQSSDLTVSGVSARATLAKQYNSLLTQIDQLAQDSSFNGTNLIAGASATNDLKINFNPRGTANLTVSSTDETSSGLKLNAISGDSGTNVGLGNFLLNSDITTTLNSLTAASSQLRTDAATFGSNLSVVQNRQDFSNNLINILDTGSSNLTNADMNQAAASSQALSTRQSLGVSALSLANTAQQGVLQLLR